MKEPALMILAAGMGSRYGGLKQVDAVGDHGESIIDFSIYDAIEAGFRELVLIIRREHEAIFEQNLVRHIRKKVKVQYAYQNLDDIPEGFTVPAGREKPWGTTHALLACRSRDTPFAICNADDFYGRDAFQKMYQFLCTEVQENHYAMIGYPLENTLTDHGSVTRGVCKVENGYLTGIEEIGGIRKKDGQVCYEANKADKTGKADNQYSCIPEITMCSMNFWGFSPAIFGQCDQIFSDFLKRELNANPMKCEHVIPTAVRDLIKEGRCRVKVLPSRDTWFGVTYQEDRAFVQEKIKDYKNAGRFPLELWN
ncbi:nucleotidyltransferase family protein [Robinsoniella peoriensis]|uniref:nucleotidyltransferase family protein n=1 Tax=Robinsoniella peoriensis TaxID=180332 RepID=UPI00362C6E0A